MSQPAQPAAQATDQILADLERVVRRACPPWLREDEDDLVQVAVLKVFPRLEAGQQLNASYLHRVAHSVVMDALRRRRNSRVELAEARVVEGAVDSPAHTPERQAGSVEIGQAIRSCMTKASEERRRLLTLYLLGHSVPESARLLDLGRKKVENHVYRGLAALRECLRALGVTP